MTGIERKDASVTYWLVVPIMLVTAIDGWLNLNEQPDLIERLSRRLDPANPGRFRRPLGLALMLLSIAALALIVWEH
jgi:hypothetical protein